MKKYIIPKWFHYSNFLPNIKKISNKWSTEKAFRFDESCAYEINEDSCVNKLFGFCFGIFGVHKNSVRFGWTYNKEMNEIFIWKYIYKNGLLNKQKVTAVELDSVHKYTIELNRDTHNNSTSYNVIFKKDDKIVAVDSIYDSSKYVLTLGPYFGGRTRAPHKMFVEQV